jgi:hypothetical protein
VLPLLGRRAVGDMDEQSVAPLLGVVPRVPAWSGDGHLGHRAGQNHGQRAKTSLLGHLRPGQDGPGRRPLQDPRQQHSRVSAFDYNKYRGMLTRVLNFFADILKTLRAPTQNSVTTG